VGKLKESIIIAEEMCNSDNLQRKIQLAVKMQRSSAIIECELSNLIIEIDCLMNESKRSDSLF
jgi:hypothetical protein